VYILHIEDDGCIFLILGRCHNRVANGLNRTEYRVSSVRASRNYIQRVEIESYSGSVQFVCSEIFRDSM
jgi:hypothetical protein